MFYVTFFFSSKSIKLVQYPFCLLLREVAKKKEKEKEKKESRMSAEVNYKMTSFMSVRSQ